VKRIIDTMFFGQIQQLFCRVVFAHYLQDLVSKGTGTGIFKINHNPTTGSR
jgi:hypothetical protein